MAKTKISELPAAAAVAGTELLAIVQGGATVKATVDDLAAAIVAFADAMTFKGVINCSTNPNYPAANAGHTYRVSVAGKIGGAAGVNVELGDVLICMVDGSAAGTQAAVGANWGIIQANIDGAVVGPAGATADRVAVFDGDTGRLIKDGGRALPAVPGYPSHEAASSTFWGVIPGWSVTGAVSTFAMVAGRRYMFPLYCDTPTSFNRMYLETTASAAFGKVFRAGILLCDEFYRPTSVLWDSGDLPADDPPGPLPIFKPAPSTYTLTGRALMVLQSDGTPTVRTLVGSFRGQQISTSLGATPLVSWRYAVASGALTTANWSAYSTTASDSCPLILQPSNLTP